MTKRLTINGKAQDVDASIGSINAVYFESRLKMRRFALTPRTKWRQRQLLLSGLQRNFGSQYGQRHGSSGSSGGHRGFLGPSAQATLCLSVRPALRPCVREGSAVSLALSGPAIVDVAALGRRV